MGLTEIEYADPDVDLLLNPKDWTPAAKKSSQRTSKDLSKSSQRLSVNDVATSFNLKEELESDASGDEKEAFIEDDNKDEDEDDWEVGMVRRDPNWGKTNQAKSSPKPLSPNVSTSGRIFGSAEVRHTTMGTLSGL